MVNVSGHVVATLNNGVVPPAPDWPKDSTHLAAAQENLTRYRLERRDLWAQEMA